MVFGGAKAEKSRFRPFSATGNGLGKAAVPFLPGDARLARGNVRRFFENAHGHAHAVASR